MLQIPFVFFEPHLAVWRSQRGCGTAQFSNLCTSKVAIFQTDFFCILTIHDGQISYVNHVLEPIHVLFNLFGFMDRGKGLNHNLFMLFSTVNSSKKEFFKANFLAVLTIHNDQISYIKHVLDPLYVLFTLFGCCRGGGGLLNDFRTN